MAPASMIRAIRYRDADAFRADRFAGSVYFDVMRDPVALWFFCPCGCGGLVRIRVGNGAKPAEAPSWKWNGSLSEPTLEPSVNRLDCGWHGWLRDGYWEAC